MKIAIITLNDYINYGNRLQVFALTQYLNSLGHDSEVLITKSSKNYILLKILERLYRKFKLNEFVKLPKTIIGKLNQTVTPISKSRMSARFKKLQTFSSLNLLEKEVNSAEYSILNNEYDLFIVGSDQVWNVNLINDLSFNDYSDNYKNVLYGGSIGDDCHTKFYLSFIAKKIKNFSFISLREFSTIQQLKSLNVDKMIHQVVDPVLLMDSMFWKRFAHGCSSKKDNFILLYYLGDVSEALRLQIKQLGNIDLLEINNDTTEFYCSSIECFVDYFRSAKYVITNSFHGTLFSIIFNKNFIALNNGHSSVRVIDILNELDLLDRYESIASIDKSIDWNAVKSKLAILKSNSYEFLRNVLS